MVFVLSRIRRVVARASHSIVTALCVIALLLLIAVEASNPLGYQLLVDHSDSMQPALAAGDVLLTRMEPAATAEAGDIVTFKDPARAGLLTHRVVSRRTRPTTYDFVTRGDANTGVERWSIAHDGRIGQYVGRVPRVGYVVAELSDGPLPLVLILSTAALLAARLLRRVWST